jgi:hypothetical protein
MRPVSQSRNSTAAPRMTILGTSRRQAANNSIVNRKKIVREPAAIQYHMYLQAELMNGVSTDLQ